MNNYKPHWICATALLLSLSTPTSAQILQLNSDINYTIHTTAIVTRGGTIPTTVTFELGTGENKYNCDITKTLQLGEMNLPNNSVLALDGKELRKFVGLRYSCAIEIYQPKFSAGYSIVRYTLENDGRTYTRARPELDSITLP